MAELELELELQMLDSIPSEESNENIEAKINKIDSIDIKSPKFIGDLKASHNRFTSKPKNVDSKFLINNLLSPKDDNYTR